MRVFIQAELENKELPIDNRIIFLSFLNYCCRKYDFKLYDTVYDTDSINDFTFSIKLHNPKFTNQKIILANNIIGIEVSTGNVDLGLKVYRSLVLQKGNYLKFSNNNSIKVISVKLIATKRIEGEKIRIKFLSPLIVKKHYKNSNDRYMSFECDQFKKELFNQVSYQVKGIADYNLEKDSFCLKPISAKKTVTSTMGLMVNCTIGTFVLNAPNDVINLLYQYGMGSRKKQGFGMFDVI